MKDVLGQAISDHYFRREPGKLWIHNTYGRKENMPVETYFRQAPLMPPLELAALHQCRGKVLDIGAGAGSHALYLQENGYDITALEISPAACNVMTARGISKIVQTDINSYFTGTYNTLLLLMNGIGLTGTIRKLRFFLRHIKPLLANRGQVLFDSSDVAYIYKGSVPLMPHYYGEIDYRYEYKNDFTRWFKWLYIDQVTLRNIAAGEGWKTTILLEDGSDQYLARLTLQR